MAEVKGSMFVGFAKIIRAAKNDEYDGLLTEQDKEVLSHTILSSKWYPSETYLNCFKAILSVNNITDMEVVRQWGKDFVDTDFIKVYANFFKDTTPQKSLEKHSQAIPGGHSACVVAQGTRCQPARSQGFNDQRGRAVDYRFKDRLRYYSKIYRNVYAWP